MKYPDNLIAWGDDLFTQNMIETLNEVTQIHVPTILGLKVFGEGSMLFPIAKRGS